MDYVQSTMGDHHTAKLRLPEHGSVGHSPPVHWLWQIQGFVDQALLEHYEAITCGGRMGE